MIEKLKNMDKGTYNRLKGSGMFWEFHPEATGDWATDSGLIRSSHDWLKDAAFQHIQILNPDGWDRANYDASMAELITREEFNRRVSMSTIKFDFLDLINDKKKEVGPVEFTD
jgi:hypothetical protein